MVMEENPSCEVVNALQKKILLDLKMRDRVSYIRVSAVIGDYRKKEEASSEIDK